MKSSTTTYHQLKIFEDKQLKKFEDEQLKKKDAQIKKFRLEMSSLPELEENDPVNICDHCGEGFDYEPDITPEGGEIVCKNCEIHYK